MSFNVNIHNSIGRGTIGNYADSPLIAQNNIIPGSPKTSEAITANSAADTRVVITDLPFTIITKENEKDIEKYFNCPKIMSKFYKHIYIRLFVAMQHIGVNRANDNSLYDVKTGEKISLNQYILKLKQLRENMPELSQCCVLAELWAVFFHTKNIDNLTPAQKQLFIKLFNEFNIKQLSYPSRITYDNLEICLNSEYGFAFLRELKQEFAGLHLLFLQNNFDSLSVDEQTAFIWAFDNYIKNKCAGIDISQAPDSVKILLSQFKTKKIHIDMPFGFITKANFDIYINHPALGAKFLAALCDKKSALNINKPDSITAEHKKFHETLTRNIINGRINTELAFKELTGARQKQLIDLFNEFHLKNLHIFDYDAVVDPLNVNELLNNKDNKYIQRFLRLLKAEYEGLHAFYLQNGIKPLPESRMVSRYQNYIIHILYGFFESGCVKLDISRLPAEDRKEIEKLTTKVIYMNAPFSIITYRNLDFYLNHTALRAKFIEALYDKNSVLNREKPRRTLVKHQYLYSVLTDPDIKTNAQALYEHIGYEDMMYLLKLFNDVHLLNLHIFKYETYFTDTPADEERLSIFFASQYGQNFLNKELPKEYPSLYAELIDKHFQYHKLSIGSRIVFFEALNAYIDSGARSAYIWQADADIIQQIRLASGEETAYIKFETYPIEAEGVFEVICKDNFNKIILGKTGTEFLKYLKHYNNPLYRVVIDNDKDYTAIYKALPNKSDIDDLLSIFNDFYILRTRHTVYVNPQNLSSVYNSPFFEKRREHFIELLEKENFILHARFEFAFFLLDQLYDDDITRKTLCLYLNQYLKSGFKNVKLPEEYKKSEAMQKTLKDCKDANLYYLRIISSLHDKKYLESFSGKSFSELKKQLAKDNIDIENFEPRGLTKQQQEECYARFAVRIEEMDYRLKYDVFLSVFAEEFERENQTSRNYNLFLKNEDFSDFVIDKYNEIINKIEDAGFSYLEEKYLSAGLAYINSQNKNIKYTPVRIIGGMLIAKKTTTIKTIDGKETTTEKIVPLPKKHIIMLGIKHENITTLSIQEDISFASSQLTAKEKMTLGAVCEALLISLRGRGIAYEKARARCMEIFHFDIERETAESILVHASGESINCEQSRYRSSLTPAGIISGVKIDPLQEKRFGELKQNLMSFVYKQSGLPEHRRFRKLFDNIDSPAVKVFQKIYAAIGLIMYGNYEAEKEELINGITIVTAKNPETGAVIRVPKDELIALGVKNECLFDLLGSIFEWLQGDKASLPDIKNKYLLKIIAEEFKGLDSFASQIIAREILALGDIAADIFQEEALTLMRGAAGIIAADANNVKFIEQALALGYMQISPDLRLRLDFMKDKTPTLQNFYLCLSKCDTFTFEKTETDKKTKKKKTISFAVSIVSPDPKFTKAEKPLKDALISLDSKNAAAVPNAPILAQFVNECVILADHLDEAGAAVDEERGGAGLRVTKATLGAVKGILIDMNVAHLEVKANPAMRILFWTDLLTPKFWQNIWENLKNGDEFASSAEVAFNVSLGLTLGKEGKELFQKIEAKTTKPAELYPNGEFWHYSWGPEQEIKFCFNSKDGKVEIKAYVCGVEITDPADIATLLILFKMPQNQPSSVKVNMLGPDGKPVKGPRVRARIKQSEKTEETNLKSDPVDELIKMLDVTLSGYKKKHICGAYISFCFTALGEIIEFITSESVKEDNSKSDRLLSMAKNVIYNHIYFILDKIPSDASLRTALADEIISLKNRIDDVFREKNLDLKKDADVIRRINSIKSGLDEAEFKNNRTRGNTGGGPAGGNAAGGSAASGSAASAKPGILQKAADALEDFIDFMARPFVPRPPLPEKGKLPDSEERGVETPGVELPQVLRSHPDVSATDKTTGSGNTKPQTDKETVLKLIKKLDSEDDLKTTKLLYRIVYKAKDTLPLIIEALVDENVKISQGAASVLAHLADSSIKEAMPPLIEALSNTNPDVRGSAAWALGSMISKEKADAAIPLINLLTDTNAEVRKFAIRALGNMPLEAIPVLIDGMATNNTDLNFGISKALSRGSNIGVPLLIEALDHNNDNIRKGAARALDMMGSFAVPKLLDFLTSKVNPLDTSAKTRKIIKLREYVDKVLFDMGVKATHALMEAVEKNDNPAVRLEAVRALGKKGTEAKEAEAVIAEALSDANAKVRCEAAWALGEICPETQKSVGALIEALKNEDAFTRDYSVRALSLLGPIAVPALRKRLEDKNPVVRQESAKALGRMGHEAKKAVPNLIKIINDNNDKVREYVVWALGRMGPEANKALYVLIERATEDGYVFVRVNAVWALGEISPDEQTVKKTLQEISIKDEEEVVREAAKAVLNKKNKDVKDKQSPAASSSGAQHQPVQGGAGEKPAKLPPNPSPPQTASNGVETPGAGASGAGAPRPEGPGVETPGQGGQRSTTGPVTANNDAALKLETRQFRLSLLDGKPKITPDKFPKVLEKLKDPDSSVYMRRTMALILYDNVSPDMPQEHKAAVVTALTELLSGDKEKDADVRAKAIMALDGIKRDTEEVISLIGNQLTDPDIAHKSVRLAALWALEAAAYRNSGDIRESAVKYLEGVPEGSDIKEDANFALKRIEQEKQKTSALVSGTQVSETQAPRAKKPPELNAKELESKVKRLKGQGLAVDGVVNLPKYINDFCEAFREVNELFSREVNELLSSESTSDSNILYLSAKRKYLIDVIYKDIISRIWKEKNNNRHPEISAETADLFALIFKELIDDCVKKGRTIGSYDTLNTRLKDAAGTETINLFKDYLSCPGKFNENPKSVKDALNVLIKELVNPDETIYKREDSNAPPSSGGGSGSSPGGKAAGGGPAGGGIGFGGWFLPSWQLAVPGGGAIKAGIPPIDTKSQPPTRIKSTGDFEGNKPELPENNAEISPRAGLLAVKPPEINWSGLERHKMRENADIEGLQNYYNACETARGLIISEYRESNNVAGCIADTNKLAGYYIDLFKKIENLERENTANALLTRPYALLIDAICRDGNLMPCRVNPYIVTPEEVFAVFNLFVNGNLKNEDVAAHMKNFINFLGGDPRSGEPQGGGPRKMSDNADTQRPQTPLQETTKAPGAAAEGARPSVKNPSLSYIQYHRNLMNKTLEPRKNKADMTDGELRDYYNACLGNAPQALAEPRNVSPEYAAEYNAFRREHMEYCKDILRRIRRRQYLSPLDAPAVKMFEKLYQYYFLERDNMPPEARPAISDKIDTAHVSLLEEILREYSCFVEGKIDGLDPEFKAFLDKTNKPEVLDTMNFMFNAFVYNALTSTELRKRMNSFVNALLDLPDSGEQGPGEPAKLPPNPPPAPPQRLEPAENEPRGIASPPPGFWQGLNDIYSSRDEGPKQTLGEPAQTQGANGGTNLQTFAHEGPEGPARQLSPLGPFRLDWFGGDETVFTNNELSSLVCLNENFKDYFKERFTAILSKTSLSESQYWRYMLDKISRIDKSKQDDFALEQGFMNFEAMKKKIQKRMDNLESSEKTKEEQKPLAPENTNAAKGGQAFTPHKELEAEYERLVKRTTTLAEKAGLKKFKIESALAFKKDGTIDFTFAFRTTIIGRQLRTEKGAYIITPEYLNDLLKEYNNGVIRLSEPEKARKDQAPETTHPDAKTSPALRSSGAIEKLEEDLAVYKTRLQNLVNSWMDTIGFSPEKPIISINESTGRIGVDPAFLEALNAYRQQCLSGKSHGHQALFRLKDTAAEINNLVDAHNKKLEELKKTKEEHLPAQQNDAESSGTSNLQTFAHEGPEGPARQLSPLGPFRLDWFGGEEKPQPAPRVQPGGVGLQQHEIDKAAGAPSQAAPSQAAPSQAAHSHIDGRQFAKLENPFDFPRQLHTPEPEFKEDGSQPGLLKPREPDIPGAMRNKAREEINPELARQFNAAAAKNDLVNMANACYSAFARGYYSQAAEFFCALGKQAAAELRQNPDKTIIAKHSMAIPVSWLLEEAVNYLSILHKEFPENKVFEGRHKEARELRDSLLINMYPPQKYTLKKNKELLARIGEKGYPKDQQERAAEIFNMLMNAYIYKGVYSKAQSEAYPNLVKELQEEFEYYGRRLEKPLTSTNDSRFDALVTPLFENVRKSNAGEQIPVIILTLFNAYMNNGIHHRKIEELMKNLMDELTRPDNTPPSSFEPAVPPAGPPPAPPKPPSGNLPNLPGPLETPPAVENGDIGFRPPPDKKTWDNVYPKLPEDTIYPGLLGTNFGVKRPVIRPGESTRRSTWIEDKDKEIFISYTPANTESPVVISMLDMRALQVYLTHNKDLRMVAQSISEKVAESEIRIDNILQKFEKLPDELQRKTAEQIDPKDPVAKLEQIKLTAGDIVRQQSAKIGRINKQLDSTSEIPDIPVFYKDNNIENIISYCFEKSIEYTGTDKMPEDVRILIDKTQNLTARLQKLYISARKKSGGEFSAVDEVVLFTTPAEVKSEIRQTLPSFMAQELKKLGVIIMFNAPRPQDAGYFHLLKTISLHKTQTSESTAFHETYHALYSEFISNHDAHREILHLHFGLKDLVVEKYGQYGVLKEVVQAACEAVGLNVPVETLSNNVVAELIRTGRVKGEEIIAVLFELYSSGKLTRENAGEEVFNAAENLAVKCFGEEIKELSARNRKEIWGEDKDTHSTPPLRAGEIGNVPNNAPKPTEQRPYRPASPMPLFDTHEFSRPIGRANLTTPGAGASGAPEPGKEPKKRLFEPRKTSEPADTAGSQSPFAGLAPNSFMETLAKRNIRILKAIKSIGENPDEIKSFYDLNKILAKVNEKQDWGKTVELYREIAACARTGSEVLGIQLSITKLAIENAFRAFGITVKDLEGDEYYFWEDINSVKDAAINLREFAFLTLDKKSNHFDLFEKVFNAMEQVDHSMANEFKITLCGEKPIKKLLLVCAVNEERSPTGEYIVPILSGEGVNGYVVKSAGVSGRIIDGVENTMFFEMNSKRTKVNHRRQKLTAKMMEEYDLIITVPDAHTNALEINKSACGKVIIRRLPTATTGYPYELRDRDDVNKEITVTIEEKEINYYREEVIEYLQWREQLRQHFMGEHTGKK